MSQQNRINFTIKIDGKEVKDDTIRIVSMTITKVISKIPVARLVLQDGDPEHQVFTISDNKVFKMGASIEISVGYDKSESIFKGIITKQNVQANNMHSLLNVECRDASYRTTLTPKNKHFANVTDSDALTAILNEYHGLEKSVESSSIKHESLLQQEITDWDFINLRAEANGKLVIVDNGKISIKKPGKDESNTSFIYGQNLLGLDISMDVRDQLKGVDGMVWNCNDQKNDNIKTKDAGECSFGNIEYSALVSVNKQENEVLHHSGTLANKEIEEIATSLVKFSRLSKVQGTIKIQGDSSIKLDHIVKIEKGAKSFQGKAYVSGIKHKIENGDWTTELTLGLPNKRFARRYNDIFGLPANGILAPVYGLQIGVVKKLEKDPQNNYRIFVYMPTINKPEEGIWCRKASFYASSDVGAFFMPEINDEVVVGFINDDPRSPIILGSLYSSKHKPAIEIDDKNSIKNFVSKSKLKLSFNDKDKEITIETPGDSPQFVKLSIKGNSIEIVNAKANKIILDKNDIKISCEGNITLDAKGSITLKAGNNLSVTTNNELSLSGMSAELKGKTKATVEGAGTAEFKSNGITIIKGSLVNIN